MIFADTNVISESIRPIPNPKVAAWLREHDAELALPAIVLAELKFGIERIRPDEGAKLLDGFFRETRRHFAGRIYPFDESSAVIYGEIMGEAARRGQSLSVPDGMIAATAVRHESPLATRNVRHFANSGLVIVNPWE